MRSVYVREMYLRRIRPFYDNEQVKVLTGVRRAGKTELLKMIRNELRPSGKTIYLNFELLDNTGLRSAAALYAHVQSEIDPKAMNYVFMDEVQLVDGWPEAVNSLKAKYGNVSIFLTGSNGELLNDDHESVLGGRTVSFKIMPFAFSEFYDCAKKAGRVFAGPDEAFAEYLNWGGFPLVFMGRTPADRLVMLESIYDSIVLRDILRRKNLRSPAQLEKIIDYVVSSTAGYISGHSIAARISGGRGAPSLPTVLEMLKAIGESCIVSFAPRYDVIGLKTLEFNHKAYCCDTAFVNSKKSLVSDLYGSLYETVVHNELVARGYKVRTGTANGKEIDFVASRGSGERFYVQVAYEITPENQRREFGNYDAVPDHYPKFVVSRDRTPVSYRGVRHVNIVDFLTAGDSFAPIGS